MQEKEESGLALARLILSAFETFRRCQKGRILAVHAGFACFLACLFVLNI